MPTAYLAVDLGSSSLRVMLGILRTDPSGATTLEIREAGRAPNVPVRRPEGLGWDVPGLFDGVLAGLRAGVEQARAAGAELRGIGVDAWGVDYARLTPHGELRPFVRHHRDADPAMAARTAATRDSAADYATTGVLDQAINTAHQLRQDLAAGIGDPDDTILLTADIFVHLLTGRVGAEASLASTTGLLDRATGEWSAALAEGLPATLPPLVQGGSSSGVTTESVTAAIGAARPVPVYAVTAHDTAAAFMAVTDAADAGTGVVSSGSWGVAGVALAAPLLDERARLAGFTQEVGAAGDTLLVKNLSGMWLLQQTLREWAELDGDTEPALDTLTRLLADAASSDYRGRFDPADPALQAPDGLVQRLEEACIAQGAPRPPSRGDLVRAIVDSLAAAYADTLAVAAALSGRALQRIRIVGGGARNELLCALTAARSGLPVVAGPVEASVRGVLLQVAIAAGDLPDAAAARSLTVDDGDGPERVHPAPPTRPVIGDHAMTQRDQLADLSRRLGDPAMDAALLGEGNTSMRDGATMLVKASGAVLGTAVPEDFVRVDLDDALALIDDERATGDDVDRYFDRVAAAEGRRPSVEALLHVVLYDQTPARVIAHSHPTHVNALLCSQHPELLVDGALFPDQIVVLGATPLLVPYIDPGLALAREVRRLLRAHHTRHGAPPSTVYLQNHGMFAIGAHPAQVLGMTAMAQKCARAIIGAASVGGVRFMPEHEVRRIDTRPDEIYRRALLAEGGDA